MSHGVVWRWCRLHRWEELQHLLPNPSTLVAISKGMQAVKLCSNKILQFLTVVTASRTRGVCIRSWLLAKDSEVREKPLQLGMTYHRRRTLRKMKTPTTTATGEWLQRDRATPDMNCWDDRRRFNITRKGAAQSLRASIAVCPQTVCTLTADGNCKFLVCVTVGEEDIHAYDLSQLQKPIDDDVESVGTSIKKWPDMSLTRPGQ